MPTASFLPCGAATSTARSAFRLRPGHHGTQHGNTHREISYEVASYVAFGEKNSWVAVVLQDHFRVEVSQVCIGLLLAMTCFGPTVKDTSKATNSDPILRYHVYVLLSLPRPCPNQLSNVECIDTEQSVPPADRVKLLAYSSLSQPHTGTSCSISIAISCRWYFSEGGASLIVRRDLKLKRGQTDCNIVFRTAPFGI